MKKQLLILALAAGSALQGFSQGIIPLDNGGFEDSSIQTKDSIKGWAKTGTVRFVTEANFSVNGQPQKQIPYDGSTKFLELRARKQDTGTLYDRGIIKQSARIPSSQTTQPKNLQFVCIYVPGAGTERFRVIVTATKFDFTTGGNIVIG